MAVGRALEGCGDKREVSQGGGAEWRKLPKWICVLHLSVMHG